jgi:hypothetical protein
VSDPVWRRWTLFAGIVVLAAGYLCAYVLFVVRSADFIFARSERDARVFSREHPLALPAHFDFGSQSGGAARLGGGWHAAEPIGAWSDAHSAWTHVAVQACGCDLRLRISGAVYTSTRTPQNRIAVIVNGKSLADVVRDEKNAGATIELRVPRAVAETGILDIELRLQTIASPLREQTGADSRKLGFLLHAIDVTAADDAVPTPP